MSYSFEHTKETRYIREASKGSNCLRSTPKNLHNLQE